MRPLVLKALDLVSPEKAGRRVIALENPGRKGLSACVGWLYSGLQVMRPGEFATAHNHASAALRFIMEGKGAYTVVDGHKMDLAGRRLRHHAERHLARSRRRSRWRDHGLAGRPRHAAGQPARRQFLRRASRARAEVELSAQRHRAGVRRAGAAADGRRSLEQALFAAVQVRVGPHLRDVDAGAPQATDGSPYDGIIMQYVNPGDRRPGDEDARRLHPVAARGRTHQGAPSHRLDRLQRSPRAAGIRSSRGKRFDWKKNDIFVVPSWAWHEHANGSEREDAVLFSFSDLPSMQALGLYREEALAENDGHQRVAH